MTRRTHVALAVAIVASAAAASQYVPAAAAPAGAVKGNARQVYKASAYNGTTPVNKPLKGYRGPLLDLQSAYVGRDAGEPTIGINRSGTAFYAASAFDGPGGLARTEIMMSEDGGKKWRSIHTKAGTVTSIPPTDLDPYVWVDQKTDRVYYVGLYVGCSYLSWTDDEGESWEHNPLACGMPVNDHQTVVTGPPTPNSPTVGYPNVLYYCVNQVVDATCARSLDGGRTFLPAGSPAFFGIDPAAGGVCGGLHGHIVTDNAGRLFMPKGHCGTPWLAVSSDGGLTWSRTKVSEVGVAGAHTAVSVDAAGNVYYVWWDEADRLPYLAVSRDNGRTFGKPLMIAPPGVDEVNFPSVDAGAAGQLVVSFPGTTVDDPADAMRPWNYYVAVTTNALAANPTFVSATSNPVRDPIHRGTCQNRCAGMFDFLDVVIAPDGTIWAAATDTCTDENGCDRSQQRATSDKGVAVRQVGGPRVKPAR